jgi:FtsH-binding integral membrane protein
VVRDVVEYATQNEEVSTLIHWSRTIEDSLSAIGAFGQWGNIGIFIASTVLLLAGP